MCFAKLDSPPISPCFHFFNVIITVVTVITVGTAAAGFLILRMPKGITMGGGVVCAAAIAVHVLPHVGLRQLDPLPHDHHL